METRSQALPWNSGASRPEIYNLSLQSPTGEILDISASLGAVTQELSFVFVETRVKVNYVSIERQTGYTLVYFQFIQPAPGIWRIFVRGRDGQNVGFHMWLPVAGADFGGNLFSGTIAL